MPTVRDLLAVAEAEAHRDLRRAHRCKHGVSGEDGCPDCDAEYLDSIERFESDNSAFAPFVPPGSQKEG